MNIDEIIKYYDSVISDINLASDKLIFKQPLSEEKTNKPPNVKWVFISPIGKYVYIPRISPAKCCNRTPSFTTNPAVINGANRNGVKIDINPVRTIKNAEM